MTALSRRRFLMMSAACAAVPTAAAASPVANWRGVALGAAASLRLEGLTETQAAPIFVAVESELNRLEDIFSLYRPQSELSRLNRDGQLLAPTPELLAVLSLCTSLYEASNGAFDPTIQPVWTALANGADPADLKSAQESIGWNRVEIQANAVRLPNPGLSALTLNGVAQGTITDRISAVLTAHGLEDVLVNMGEVAAKGRRGDGNDWRVGLAGPERQVQKTITLKDRAVATSDSNSLMLTDAKGHILNPNGRKLSHRIASVSAPSAAIADGLSTALCALPDQHASSLVNAFPEATLEMYM